MGVFVPLVKTAAVQIINKLFGQACVTGFHWLTDQALSETFLGDLAQVFDEWNYATLFAHLSERLANDSVRATDVSSLTGPSVLRVHTGNVGTFAETKGIPSNAALCVTGNTLKRGRSYRSRNYLGGIPQASLAAGDADTVTPEALADILEDFGVLVEALDTFDATGALVVASKYHDGLPRSSGVLTPITTFAVNDQMDSMRRRLRGRGT